MLSCWQCQKQNKNKRLNIKTQPNNAKLNEKTFKYGLKIHNIIVKGGNQSKSKCHSEVKALPGNICITYRNTYRLIMLSSLLRNRKKRCSSSCSVTKWSVIIYTRYLHLSDGPAMKSHWINANTFQKHSTNAAAINISVNTFFLANIFFFDPLSHRTEVLTSLISPLRKEAAKNWFGWNGK